jgi:hypothetical protein
MGQNQLTGVSKVYPLGSVAVPAISGTATFFKRVNEGISSCTIAKYHKW